MSQHWRDDAACATGDHDPDMWFSLPDTLEHARALSICRRCPSRMPCLSEALEHRHVGIWGATHVSERQTIEARRAANRAAR